MITNAIGIEDLTTSYHSTASIGLQRSDISTVIFQAFVVAIAVVGTLANGSLCALLAQLECNKRGSINILILNQMSIDFFSCFWLFVVYCVKLRNIFLTGMWGYLVCQLITSEVFIWIGLLASVTSMVMITLERYAKLVHPVSHKKYFRKWMIYAGVVISWTSGFLQSFPVSWFTTDISQGQCLESSVWPSVLTQKIYTAWYLLLTFALPLCIFVYCYGHILVMMRRRAKVFGGNIAANDTQQARAMHVQMNVIKTMLTIVTFFLMSWIPSVVYSLVNAVSYDFNFQSDVYFTIIGVTFLNVCVNPFIYGAQYKVIKNRIDGILNRLSTRVTSIPPQLPVPGEEQHI